MRYEKILDTIIYISSTCVAPFLFTFDKEAALMALLIAVVYFLYSINENLRNAENRKTEWKFHKDDFK